MEEKGSASFDGATLYSAGGMDGFLASLTAQGGLRWARRFGGTGDDFGNRVAVDRGGSAVVVGFFNGHPKAARSGTVACRG